MVVFSNYSLLTMNWMYLKFKSYSNFHINFTFVKAEKGNNRNMLDQLILCTFSVFKTEIHY